MTGAVIQIILAAGMWAITHLSYISAGLAIVVLTIQIFVGWYNLKIKKAEYEKICGPGRVLRDSENQHDN